MRNLVCLVLALCSMIVVLPSLAQDRQTPAVLVRGMFAATAPELTFAKAKLAIDRFADPSIDEAAVLTQLAAMAATVQKMLSKLPSGVTVTDMETMQALRTYLYEPGWWNNGQAFQYDLSDPFGQQPGAQMLTRYLATRKGNCVSMPMLFAILGEKLGLDVTLSTAPLHIFVKFTDRATGKTWNLETTSGAGFTRDEHYRKITPMTDEAVANGVYLKRLSRPEALSVMATGVLDTLLATGRYGEAIAVTDVLVEAYPANAYAMAKQGTAYYRLLERDFIRKYPNERDIPRAELPRAIELNRANLDAFAKAEALGWREPKLN